MAAVANDNGQQVITTPAMKRPLITAAAKPGAPSGLLLAAAALLLLALAAAMGIVSWHAQYAFIYRVKRQEIAAALEALGLDAGAVIFSVLGIALARIGRRAAIERALVCVCAAGSAGMNAAGANLGSPRSVAAFLMPPVLFAITSDRLVSVIRRSALGPKADADAQRSAWRAAGLALLYVLRLAVAPPSTMAGARQALLNATPLPGQPEPAAITPAPQRRGLPSPRRKPRGSGPGRTGPTKYQLITDAAVAQHGPLASIPLDQTSRISTQLARNLGCDPGQARKDLRAAVLAARNGDPS